MKTTVRLLLKTTLALLCFGNGVAGFETGTVLPRPDANAGLVRTGRFALPTTAFDEKTRVVLFFYSASWCAPCKKVAAVLREQYPELRRTAPHLEIATYSLDHSPRARADYLRDTTLPWPAIEPALIEDSPWLREIEGGTPQFQAFALDEHSLTALTPPGPPDEILARVSEADPPK